MGTSELQEKSLELALNLQKLGALTRELVDYAEEIRLIAERLKEQTDG